jgi:hypothetical protein
MADYEYFEQFLDGINAGLTEAEALVEVTYDMGLITKNESARLVTMLEEATPNLKRDWTVPEDAFEKVVFMTGWNEWVQCIAMKIMQNGTVLSVRSKDPEEAKNFTWVHHFPQTLDEMSLQQQIDALMADKTGFERKLTMYVNVLNRRSIFALQCMLSLSEQEIRDMLKKRKRVSITLLHSGNGKFTKLKRLLRPYGLDLSLGGEK